MSVDARTVGLLARALGHELDAVQLYLAQARLAGLWGMEDAARRFRADVSAELVHAGVLMERMLELGAAPNPAPRGALRLGRTLEEMLAIDRRLEQEAVHLYGEALRYCERRGDEASSRLFRRLLDDELEHLKELDAWIEGAAPEALHA
mgnify:CR=1 FL=1